MEIKTKHRRRTQAEWHRVIDEQKRSGLSQEKYCQQHGVAYSSFQSWRARFSAGERPVSTSIPSFIELPSTLASASSWDIELDLGHGIVLRMKRAS